LSFADVADDSDQVYRGWAVVAGCGDGAVLVWLLVLVLVLALVFVVAVAGLVVGVGEAGVDGVIQVESLAVPGGDDGVRGDV
jgi:hypothetical protein